jgi:hypothetical protein
MSFLTLKKFLKVSEGKKVLCTPSVKHCGFNDAKEEKYIARLFKTSTPDVRS